MTARNDRDTVTEAELLALHDGALSADRAAEVSAYLENHLEHAPKFAAWQRQDDVIRRLYGPAMEEPVPPRLDVRAIAAARGRTVKISTVLAAALAACLVIGAVGGWTWRGALVASHSTGAGLVADAIAAHRLYSHEILHPVEMRADQRPELASWLSHRLARPLNIPDLSAEGLHLIGGRLLPAGGRPAAQLMYETRAGERVTLFITPTVQSKESGIRYVEDGDLNALSWREDQLSCTVVGPLPRQTLHAITVAAYQQLT